MALRILLSALGGLLSLASRVSHGMRAAITRDMIVEIATRDGVAHHFVFRDRRVTSGSGSAPSADCVLRFATSLEAFKTLASRRTIGRLYAGLLDGSVTIDGNPFHALWFYGLTQRVAPLAKRPRRATPPGAYKMPSTTVPWAARVTREPAAAELDPHWTSAVQQRARLRMMRVAAGEPTLAF